MWRKCWACYMLIAATGATMDIHGTMRDDDHGTKPETMREDFEVSAQNSPFAVSQMVTKGRIKVGFLGVMLEILPSASINNTLEEARLLLQLAKTKASQHSKTSFINLRIEAIEETIQMLRDTFERFHNGSYSSRTKRAWLDLGGNFLKTVFGVATEKDVQLIKLENKKDTDNIKIALNKMSIDNQILKTSIRKLAEAIEMQYNFLDENIFHVSQSTFNYMHIMNALSLASDTLFLGNILTLQYKEISSSLNRGIIPPNIISTKIIEKIINEGKINFPDNIFSVDLKNVNEVLEQVEIKKTKDIFKYILYFPMVSDTIYSIYKIMPLPVAYQNKFFIIKNNEEFIGIGNKNYFVSNELPVCKGYDRVKVCNVDLKLFRLNVSSCALDIVLKKQNTICPMEQYVKSSSSFIGKLGESWYVIFYSDTDVIITCRNKRTIRSMAGLIKISPPCKLSTKEFELSTKIEDNSNFKISKSWHEIKVFDINNISDHEKINDRQFENFVKINKTLEIIVKNSKENISNFVIENADRNFYYKMHFSVNYTLFLVILLILGCIGVLIFKKYKKESVQQSTEEMSLHENHVCKIHERRIEK